ncbi:MAG: orotidine-5'-phosphate decarboxylase [Endomicrobia bacterium]|nr:orotidine-5'-phosphate decarboxylase [Endomicrobiia bacterium]
MTLNLVIALDIDYQKAKLIVKQARDFGFKFFKIGHLLFDTHPEIVNYITNLNCNVLLDLKFCDIPSSIAKAVKEILTKYKIWGLTLHTLGGKNMLKEVKSVVSKFDSPPLLFAVTILTSLSSKDLILFGFRRNMENTVVALAKIAKSCGVDGVVCSPREVSLVKKSCGKNFLTLVPGVSINNKNIDQSRCDTIEKVISLNADYIVLGRSIYESQNINKTLKSLSSLFK